MRLALAGVIIASLAANAGANGRPAGTSTIHWKDGDTNEVAAGMTFGLLLSHDGGTTWHWMCEAAVGYAGLYDPDYVYASSGALFATTFDGFKVSRGDHCTFDTTVKGSTFMSQAEEGPDNALYLTASDNADDKIYKSTDDGMTFPTSTTPGQLNDWWETLRVAPGDASKLFMSGYRYLMVCDANSPQPDKICTLPADCQDGTHVNGACVNRKVLLAFKSTNGGTSFTAMPGNLAYNTEASSTAAGFTTSKNSTLDLIGVTSDGATLYGRITQESEGQPSDALYKLDTVSGTQWTRVLGVNDSLSAVLRSNGDLVVGTQLNGAQKSTNGGTTWTPLANAPHINCLYEQPTDHSIWACTQNYGSPPGIPSDGYGIMKTTDLSTWTGVLKFQDIQDPVTCAAGTPQHDTCVATNWCGLKQQLGITSTAVFCPSLVDGGPADGGIVVTPPKKSGCCAASSDSASTAFAGSFLVGLLFVRRRRRRAR